MQALSNFFSNREEEKKYYKNLQNKEDKEELKNNILDLNKRVYIEDMGFTEYKQCYSDWSW